MNGTSSKQIFTFKNEVNASLHHLKGMTGQRGEAEL